MKLCILIIFILTTPFVSMGAGYQYSPGLAFKESKAMFSATDNKHLDSESTLFMKEVKGFGATEYFIWTGNMIKHGKNIRNAQNIIHDTLTKLGRGGVSDENKANDILQRIFDLHKSITIYEKDVYDFVNVASISYINEKSSIVNSLMALLKDIKDTENTTYALTTSIINNVSADKITKESLEISRQSRELSKDSVTLAKVTNKLTILSIIIAVLAFFVSFMAIRFQIVTLILNQLSEKAKECNSYLDNDLAVPCDIKSVSSILSSIITAKQIKELHSRNYRKWLLFERNQKMIDNFHLQLHTSIRIWIRAINYSMLGFENETIKAQLNDVKDFLRKSIENYDC